MDSNLLEYLPEASRAHNATTAYVQVEKVPLQATPEGLKSFLEISNRFVSYAAVNIRLLLQFHSDG
jgi:hypothetical protein